MDAADVNLYLVGFMGTGKTTVGWAVAHRLGFKCVDSDHHIEHEMGQTVSEIFAQHGEAEFRRREALFVESGHAELRTVVACGGGLVAQPGLLDRLKAKGVVICLHASIETILARSFRSGRTRPLLDVANPEERARALFALREPIYRSAGTVVLTDGRSPHEIVGHVIRIWRREAAEFVRNSGRIIR